MCIFTIGRVAVSTTCYSSHLYDTTLYGRSDRHLMNLRSANDMNFRFNVLYYSTLSMPKAGTRYFITNTLSNICLHLSVSLSLADPIRYGLGPISIFTFCSFTTFSLFLYYTILENIRCVYTHKYKYAYI